MTELRTRRLLLRRPEHSDLDGLHGVFSDPEAMRYWSTLPHSDSGQAAGFIAAMQDLHDREGSEFVVELGGRAIGKAGIWDAPELGFILHRAFWGRGQGSEAASAVIGYGFDTMALDEVKADVDPRNDESLRLLSKLGFEETGRATATLMLGDEVCDSVYLALSCARWKKSSQSTLQSI